MSKLDAALAWARRGFRVFPLAAGSKVPLDTLSWTLHATTDESVIRGWWTDPVLKIERDHNIAMLTTDWIVSDIDTKKDKPGIETMQRLGLGFDTLVLKTATGGFHLVYNGLTTLVGGAPLGMGVDIKSLNGYIVAPGSTLDVIEGGGNTATAVQDLGQEEIARRLAAGAQIVSRTYAVEIDQPVIDFPEHLRHLLKVPRRRADVIPADVELDTPETVELVAHWLLHDAPVAVEGMNGDDTTFKVACRMRDYGISEPQAVDLFLDEYNNRCDPPWTPEEAALKIENAYRYASGAAGALSPAAVFGHVVPVAPPVPPDVFGAAPLPVGDGFVQYGNMLAEDDIQVRPWVLYGMLMRGVVTTLVAPGGAGKSLLALIIAAHLAVGKDFLTHRCVVAGKSVVYNAEDDVEEMSRRLNAVIVIYGLDPKIVVPRIALLGSDAFEMRVTKDTPPVPNVEHIQKIDEACADPELVMFSIDPLVEVHTGRENDVGDMRNVMGIFRALARKHKIPIMIVQHTGKPPNDKSSHAGDQMAARGSSAIPAAARIVLTLAVATKDECLQIGVPEAQRTDYVRLDGAKASAMAAKDRASARWLKWVSHRLANGDSVGVLQEHDAVSAAGQMLLRIVQILGDHMVENGTASMTVDQGVAVCGGAGYAINKGRLQAMLALPVPHGSHTVAYAMTPDSGRSTMRIVMR